MSVLSINCVYLDGEILIDMDTKLKQAYLAPPTQVSEVAQEGVICVSGERKGYGQAIEDEWE